MFKNRFKNYKLEEEHTVFTLTDIVKMVKSELKWLKENGYWGNFNEL